MLAYSGLSIAVAKFEDRTVQIAIVIVLLLAGLPPSNQTVGSLLRTRKIKYSYKRYCVDQDCVVP
jgi:hypothetical protein